MSDTEDARPRGEDEHGFWDAVKSIFGTGESRRTDPDKLEVGEYEAVHRDRGFIDLYDGFDDKPMMSVPLEDAERIRSALTDAIEEADDDD